MKRLNYTAILAAGVLLATASYAKQTSKVDYLFTQSAKKVTIQKCKTKVCDYKVVLHGANARTTYFTNRPNRKGGEISTKEFVNHWSKGKNNFASDHPNASLVYFKDGKPMQSIVILSKPKLKGDGTLSYAVKYVSNDKLHVGHYHHAVIFIDGWGIL